MAAVPPNSPWRMVQNSSHIQRNVEGREMGLNLADHGPWGASSDGTWMDPIVCSDPVQQKEAAVEEVSSSRAPN